MSLVDQIDQVVNKPEFVGQQKKIHKVQNFLIEKNEELMKN